MKCPICKDELVLPGVPEKEYALYGNGLYQYSYEGKSAHISPRCSTCLDGRLRRVRDKGKKKLEQLPSKERCFACRVQPAILPGTILGVCLECQNEVDEAALDYFERKARTSWPSKLISRLKR